MIIKINLPVKFLRSSLSVRYSAPLWLSLSRSTSGVGGECGVMGSEIESETAAVSFGPCGVCEAPLTSSLALSATGIHLYT